MKADSPTPPPMTPNAPNALMSDPERPGNRPRRRAPRGSRDTDAAADRGRSTAAGSRSPGLRPLAARGGRARGGVLITLHSSLQHEIVHGHPTRWLGVNRLLAMLPLSLWLPFERYRRATCGTTSTSASPTRSMTRSPSTGRPRSGRASARSHARVLQAAADARRARRHRLRSGASACSCTPKRARAAQRARARRYVARAPGCGACR